MALVLADRVKETTTTTGTGTVTLAGAATGFQSFAVVGNGNTTYYCIAGQTGSEWEVGIGTYTSAGTTLSRTTVLASSNAGALVTFSAGTKDVFCTYASTKSVYEDGSGNVDGYPITGGSINNTPIGATTPNTIAGTTVTATASTSGSSATGAYSYGTLSYSDQNNLMTLQSSANSYNQLVLQNTSANSAASADLTISNDQGTATTFYGNFGINSSGWLGTLGATSLNAPNVVYVTGTSGDLVLGTTTSNPVRIVVAAGADAVTIDTSSRVGVGVTGPTAALHLKAGTATAFTAPLKFTSGTLLSAAEAATVEYDGTVYYTTPNTTSGRGYTPSTHIFRLTATGSAVGPAISNFFGANSAINLAAAGVYEIEAYCYFTKTTAGTIVVTATSSLAPVNLNGSVDYGAVGGGTATGAANRISLFNSTATGAAFGASGSLTTAVSHLFIVRLIVEANASASNLRINFTASAGTFTPLRGSYYKVTRLPAGNSGSFAA